MTRSANLRTAARYTAGGAIAVVALVVVGGGVALGWMPRTAPAPSVSVAPVAADAVLTCPGPLLALARDGHSASGISVASGEDVTAGGALRRDVLATTGVPGESGPTRLEAAATGRTVPAAAGAASATVTAEDLAGFAAAACTPALMESWLVGGSTSTGAADLVLLANPGKVTATVDLTFYGVDGPRHPGAGSRIIVAPGTQQVLPLAGLGFGDEAPILRVTATGAPVRAALQSSIVRGLTPGGVDQEGAIAAAATTQVIPGVRVTAPTPDAPAVVRLLAPTGATTATVTVLGARGAVGSAMTVPLKAGAPVEASLPALAPGSYTVVVTADQPVVAAVWQTTGTGAGDDFAWIPAAPQLAPAVDGSLFAVPAGPSPALVVTPAGKDAVAVSIAPADGGTATTVSAAAGRATVVPLAAGRAYRIALDGAAYAAVTFAGDGALASYPVWPQDAASASVVVYP